MSVTLRSFIILFVLNYLLSLPVVRAQHVSESKLVKAYNSEPNPSKRFWKLYDLANHYKRTNFHKADSIRGSLIALSYSSNDSARFLARIYEADVDKLLGDKNGYFRKIPDLLSFLQFMNSSFVEIEVYNRQAELHLYKRETDEAVPYLRKAMRMAMKSRNLNAQVLSNCLMSEGFLVQHNKDSAQHYAIEAIAYAKRCGDEGIKSDALHNWALVFAHFGQNELAASKNFLARAQAEKSGDIYRQARLNLYLGEAQAIVRNYKDARDYFALALNLAEGIGDKHTYCLAMSHLGMLSLYKGDTKKAIGNMRSALRILQEYDEEGQGFINACIGDFYTYERDFKEAARSYNASLRYYEQTGNRERIAQIFHKIGYVFEQQGKYQKALNYLDRSVQINSQFINKEAVYPTYKTISDVYFRLGDIRKAYHYLSLYAQYADSTSTNDVNAKITEISAAYQTDELRRVNEAKQDSINNLRQSRVLEREKNINLELRTNLQTYVILGFVIFMLLGGVIGFYRWNQTKIKQQQQQAEMNQTLLRAQMNPHFVFNAMSVIQSYIYDNDTKNSAKFLVNFSKLMRLILENSSKESIPIKTEFEILDKYLNIQKLRFEERFEFNIEVEDILYEEDSVIPPMITQPFIENAIEHGRLHLREDGFINIHFFKHGNMLRITVEDNGVGRKGAEMNKKSKEHKSMAMKITRDRIDNLNKKYRSDGFLLIEDFNKEEETGTKVLISIPYRVNNQI